MKELLAKHPRYFDSLLKNDQFRISIIYTRIDRKGNNEPRFINYYYNVDPGRYFYPASTVKMPVAFLSLQRLKEIGIEGLDKESTMITGQGMNRPGLFNDPTSADGRPTIANYIRKIFLVSDNEAYNRLYEFLGQEYINHTLHRMGYDSTQVVHRLEVSLTEEENRHNNPVQFYDTAGKMLYQQPLTRSNLPYQQRHTQLGKGYVKGGQLVNGPFDFSRKNRITLEDLHSMLQSVIFPQAVPEAKRFNLGEEDYQFLYRYMSMKPKESLFPAYGNEYEDAYIKFLLYGGKGNMEDSAVRIFNKPGDAYGFLTDVAYIVDFRNNVEFFLSASIHCNSDGIYNDSKYDYDSIGFPFMKNLGAVFYKYELQRNKKRQADLSGFRIDYGN